jgi:hypothetical protein
MDNDSEAVRRVAHRIRDQWLLASKGYFGGCVPSDMKYVASTPEGIAIVRAAIDSLRGALRKMPPTLDENVLNLLGFDPDGLIWTAHVETRRLLEIADAFSELLDGKVDTAWSKARMPGSL